MIANRVHRSRQLHGSSTIRLRIKRSLFVTEEEAAKILGGLKRASPAWMRPKSPPRDAPKKKKAKVATEEPDAGSAANGCKPGAEVAEDQGVIVKSGASTGPPPPDSETEN